MGRGQARDLRDLEPLALALALALGLVREAVARVLPTSRPGRRSARRLLAAPRACGGRGSSRSRDRGSRGRRASPPQNGLRTAQSCRSASLSRTKRPFRVPTSTIVFGIAVTSGLGFQGRDGRPGRNSLLRRTSVCRSTQVGDAGVPERGLVRRAVRGGREPVGAPEAGCERADLRRPTAKQTSETGRSVRRRSGGPLEPPREQVPVRVSPNARRYSREKCAGESRAARARVGTSSGSR